MTEEELHPIFKECGEWAAELQRQCVSNTERGYRFQKDGPRMIYTFDELRKQFVKVEAAINAHAAACVAEIMGPSPQEGP